MLADIGANAGVQLHYEGETAIVTLARPTENAIDLAAAAALTEIFHQLAADPPAGGVVLTGSGASFCTGIEITGYNSLSGAERIRLAVTVGRMLEELYFLPTAVVAAVNGDAVGSGFVLALAADARVITTSSSSRFGLPEAAAGVMVPAFAMHVISQELAPAVARRLSMDADLQPLADVAGMGIAGDFAAPDALLGAAVDRARSVAAQSAFVAIKSLLRSQAADLFAVTV